jgi:membrane associated rhomboid family serine protease
MIPIRDNLPSKTTPFVLWALIAANAIVFLLELLLGREQTIAVVFHYGVVPARYFGGMEATSPAMYVLPLITHMFLHGGWMHLIFNLLFLYIFADNVEDRMGHVRFAVFYLLCGLAAVGAHIVMQPESEVPVVGASGAIGGVLGAYLLLFPKARLVVVVPILFYPLIFQVPAVSYMVIWFVLQIFSGMQVAVSDQQGGVAFWAHIGGFVSGIALRFVFARGDDKARKRRRRKRRAAAEQA